MTNGTESSVGCLILVNIPEIKFVLSTYYCTIPVCFSTENNDIMDTKTR